MDAGNHPSHPTGTTRHYLADWWNKDFRPRPADIINNDNLLKCLKYHRDEEQSTLKATTPATQDAQWQLVPGSMEMPCLHCALYRGQAMDNVHYLHDIRNRLQGQEAVFDNHRLLSSRRTAAFNTLFEKAVFNETEGPAAARVAPAQSAPPPAPSVPQPRRSRQIAGGPPAPTVAKTLTIAQLAEVVRDNSEAQYKRLQQHLEQHGSQKWTWGVDVQDDEIKHMFRAANRDFKLPHTGYNYSLGGPIPGDSTVLPALPTASERGLHTSVDVPEVPDLDDTAIPTHFNEYPLRRLRSRILSQKLSQVPANYVLQGADGNADAVYSPIAGTLTSPTAVSTLDVPVTSSMRAAGTLTSPTTVSTLDVPVTSSMRAKEKRERTTESMPVTANDFPAAAALEALEMEESPMAMLHVSAMDAFNALEQEYGDINNPEDDTWDKHPVTNVSFQDVLQALQTEHQQREAQSMVVDHVSGADALRALDDVWLGADDVVDTQPIVIEDSDEDDVSGAVDKQPILIEDSDDTRLEYIDSDEHQTPSFRRLGTEDDPLTEQSIMITVPVTAAEAWEALQDETVKDRSSAHQHPMPSGRSMWTAADFEHCVTPDDLGSDSDGTE